MNMQNESGSRISRFSDSLHGSRFSFFHMSLVLFLIEACLYVALLSPSPESLRMILSLPFLYLLPGCLLLLSTKKKDLDIVKFVLNGFFISAFLSVGASLAMGGLLGKLSEAYFTAIPIAASVVSLILIWRNRLSREIYVFVDRYGASSIALAVVFFSALMILYMYKTPISSSDSARYFHAAQNYIKSFSFSPYPPFPLQSWETGAAHIGGAIDFRNFWVVLIALQSLVAQSTSVAVVRPLNYLLGSLLVVATFHLGSNIGDRKLGILAAFFTALNSAIIFYEPYEVPYIGVALFALFAFSLYISAMGGESKNFKLAIVALSILFVALFLHITVLFFALALIPHFLFVMFKHGGRYSRILGVFLMVAFGLMAYRYSAIFITPRFAQYMILDLERSIWTIYGAFLIPIYFTVPLWILFIVGILFTLVHRKDKPMWFQSVGITLLAITIYLIIFAYFRFGVTFRWFLVFIPLMTIIAAYGFLETPKAYKRDLVFSCVLFLVLIAYLANQYPWTFIFPYGIVTVNEVYLTLVPAICVLIWKVLWKEAYNKRNIGAFRVKLNLGRMLSSLFVIVVSIALVSDMAVFIINPSVGVYLNPAEVGMQEAGKWIGDNVEPGSILATNAWTHLGLYVDYTKTPIVAFPSGESSLREWISQGKIDYMIVLTNLYVSYDYTWFHIYPYLKKYSDPTSRPPFGTTEEKRGENFVVFKVMSSYGVTTSGVLSRLSRSSEIWTLENGFVRLNLSRSTVLFSSFQGAEYVALSQLDLENTSLVINGTISQLGKWDSIQFLNHTTDEWTNWTDVSYPLNSIPYTQQGKVRLLWNGLREGFSCSTYITLERGRSFSQIQWRIFSLNNSTVTIAPSIKPMGILNRAYIPSSQPSSWSTESTLSGNPANVSLYGLGFVLSQNSEVTLRKGSYTAQQLPGNLVRPGKTKISDVSAFTYTFDVVNEAATDQWAVIEAYVPDRLVDKDLDGFYNVWLQSYNVTEGAWRDFARWDSIEDSRYDAGPWADSALATLLDGTKLNVALGYNQSDMRGVGLYEIGEREKTVDILKVPKYPWLAFDAPAKNITYSRDYGLLKRLGFAIHLPAKTGQGSNEMSLRLYIAFDESTSMTYEFSSAADKDYGLGSMNASDIWLYNPTRLEPSLGLVLDKKPSFLSTTEDMAFNFTSLSLGYNLSDTTYDGSQFYTNLAFFEQWPWVDSDGNSVPDTFENSAGDTALALAHTSLANYNFTFSGSDDSMTMAFEKFKIKDEFNSNAIYTVALDEKWTWISGGKLLRNLQDNDLLLEVSGASSVSFKIQPRAIDPDRAIREQAYDNTEKTLKIKLASGYSYNEMYGTLIIYALRRVVVYSGNLRPAEVFVNSKTYDWLYDETTRLLKVTIYEVVESEIDVTFNV